MIRVSTIILLLYCASLSAQSLSHREIKYLKKKSIPLQIESDTEQWYKLNRKIKNKKLILLGECNHGSREIFLLKNNLIEHLNRAQNFDVLLFESGLAELIEYYDNDSLPIKQLSHVWETEAFADLLSYAKQQNMDVAGFDVFVTGDAFQKRLNGINESIHPNIEKQYVSVLDALKNRKITLEEILESTNSLISNYKKLTERFTPKSKIEQLTKRGIENRIASLRYMLQYKKDNNFPKQLAARDSLMAANINWLMTNIYPNKKAIVYTHNIHASKYNLNEEMMGEWLKPKWKEQMYAIGTFVASGTYSGYDGKVKTISKFEKHKTLIDIKTIINILTEDAAFIEIPQKPSRKTKWLFQNVLVNDTFIDLQKTNTMTLSNNFDGLIFIKEVSAPNFLE